MTTIPLQISNSEIQTFKDCQRKWWLTYYRELGLKRGERSMVGARDLGSRFHTVMHVMYTDLDAEPLQVLSDIYDADEKAIRILFEGNEFFDTEEEVLKLRKEQDLAHAMLTGFLEWRAENGLDHDMELIAAETVVEVPLNSMMYGDRPVHIRGKMDQRWMRKIDGARIFRDWKTVGSLTDPTLPLNEQMKFYHLLEYLDAMAKADGKEPEWRTDGALYTMVKKSKRTARAAPPFYSQIEIHNNLTELRSMWRKTVRTVSQIVATRLELDAGADHMDTVPPRPSKDCSWKCDFFAACGLFDDGSNVEGLLTERYAHLDPHERYQAEDEGKEVSV